MNKKEVVLESYLKRVLHGDIVVKKTIKTIHFPEQNLRNNNWNVQMFKNFVSGCASYKSELKMYKARVRGVNK
jgi:hypothetical protein